MSGLILTDKDLRCESRESCKRVPMSDESYNAGPTELGRPSEHEGSIWSARRIVVVVVVYVLGFIATFFLGAALNRGLDSSAHEVLPFLLVYDFLFGLIIGGWWLLLLPAFYYYVFELVVSVLKHGSHGTANFDRTEFFLVGTLAIAMGVGGNALVHLLRRQH